MSMSFHSQSEKVQCPNCGANVRPSSAFCPACGAPLSAAASVSDGREKLLALINTTNQNLVKAGTAAAESAFGLGCSLGTIAGLFILAIVFLLGARNWILLAILAMGIALIAAGISAVISTRAKSATIGATYNREVKPEIEGYIRSNALTRQDFNALVDETLDKDAPLRRCLAVPLEQDLAALEN
jgi:hypothetical protein